MSRNLKSGGAVNTGPVRSGHVNERLDIYI
jgi:hypothetical protein